MFDLIFIVLGIVLIMLGFLLMIIETIPTVSKHEIENKSFYEKKVEGGGVILIGPIPIVFASDKRYALIAMVLAIVIMLLAIMMLKLYY